MFVGCSAWQLSGENVQRFNLDVMPTDAEHLLMGNGTDTHSMDCLVGFVW